MPPRRRIDPARGRAALEICRTTSDPDRDAVATAVRWILQELGEIAPGGATEVRVPPFGVVQCLAGPRHTRGTPPNVVQTDPATLLGLAVGTITWDTALATGRVLAGGTRADLSEYLPLAPPPQPPAAGRSG
jgi:hypothetical protein